MLRRLRGDNPHLWHFQSELRTQTFFVDKNLIGSLFYTSTQSDGPPLSAEQNGLSLSHLVPEILGPKVGLIFHQNVLFNRFKAFCINFPLMF